MYYYYVLFSIFSYRLFIYVVFIKKYNYSRDIMNLTVFMFSYKNVVYILKHFDIIIIKIFVYCL